MNARSIGCLVLLAGLWVSPVSAQEKAFGIWDAGAVSVDDAAKVAARTGWTAIAKDATPTTTGDAVLANGRVLAVVRKAGTGVDLYSLGSGAPIFRAKLVPTPAGTIEKITVVENGRSTLAVDIATKSGTTQLRLKKGERFVETQAGPGTKSLHVECPSRFAVLPDFFADDILFDARKVPIDRVELPSENFVLSFTGKEDAIVMNVFENRDQDVRLNLAGKGDARAITGSEIDFGKAGSKIWVAVLEGPGTWHALDVTPADANKIIQLPWQMPYVAQWRCDFTRQDGLTDSWDMLLPNKDGSYTKPSWLAQDGKISDASRTSTGEVDVGAYKPGGPASDQIPADRGRWTTVLGWVKYPVWSDPYSNGFIQPLNNRRLKFNGPVLLYALTRLADTPVQQYTPVDIVRATMGVGPCQHILDVEGQKQEHVGRATCHVRTALFETYEAGQQKAKKKEIEAYLNDAHEFVTHIRKRITAYVEFGKETRKYLDEQRAAHPELKASIDALAELAAEIDDRVEPRLKAIVMAPSLKLAASELTARNEPVTPPNLAAQLNRDFLANNLGDIVGPGWKDRLKREYTDPLTTIGGQQDETVGDCRWVVKALRQKAGILIVTEPAMAPIATEIRNRTQKMLRGGAAYEGARH
jgi:hypothetical protein